MGGGQTSPLLERLKARGYEVLYLRDPVDEWTFQSLADYGGMRFQDVAKEGLKFGACVRGDVTARRGHGRRHTDTVRSQPMRTTVSSRPSSRL
jgi:HSP90 family molecular chaperone